MNRETSNFGTRLKHAISDGDITTVRRIIKGGVNVNDKSLSWYGTTVLHLAVSSNHLEIVKLLLQAKAYVNTPNQDGRTALHLAARTGNANITQELIKAKAKVNAVTNDGRTALHVATWRGHTEVVSHLVEAGAKVNMQDEDKWTPLYWAAKLNYRDIAKLLVSHGADINHHTEKGGYTPLHLAVINGNIGMAKFLIHEGADINEKAKGQGLSLLLLQKNKHIDLLALKDFLEFCIAHDYRISKDEIVTKPSVPHFVKFTKDEKFRDWLDKEIHSVPMLSCMCRHFIRKYLIEHKKIPLSQHIQELQLPKILSSFLDFDGEECETLLKV